MSRGRPFAARFNGRCHAGDDISKGDEIQYLDVPGHDEHSVLVHTSCIDNLDQSTRPDDTAPYCGAFFTFHRGEC